MFSYNQVIKKVMKENTLLVEKYRPIKLDNYVGNESIKKSNN